MSKKLFFLMAFVVVLSMFSAPAFATDYHIDPVNGSDTTGDGSFGNPWETFANIQYYYWYLDRPSGWVQLQPGETIYLMNGIHNTPIDEGSGYKPCIARFRTYHGSPGNWFRIAAYPGHSPVIDGQHSNVGINVFQSSYWEIEGVEIINGLPWGMDIAEFNNGKVHNVNIHDTIGYDNEAGLHLLGCDEIEIYDSVFYDNFNPTMVSSEPIEGGSNIITFGGEDCTIHDCLFYQSQPFPTDLRQVGVKNKHASRSPGGTFKVYNNTFIDCRAFAFQSGTEGTHFHHNLIVGGCDMAAIRSLDGGGYTHQVDQTFEYNTLYDASEFVMIPTMTWRNEDFPDDPKNINFNNNIIYDTDTLQINIGRYMSDELYYIMVDEFHSNYNCYYNSDQATQKYEIGSNNQETQEGGSYTLSQWQTNFGWDLNSTESDPLFVDAPNGDFHLQAGSPAAGMGMYAGTGPQPPSQASNPNPANSATDVSVDADLSWTAGSGSTSSDVYFGTDSTPDSGELQGNQTATTFDPGTLNNSTTYYWQIDEINAEGTTTGNVWSFTTEAVPSPPGQASNPSPANSASDVSINADLSWTAGSGATSHDVYFGTTSPGAYQGNQTATTFDTGAMANDTTYYWRIDEVNAQGTTTGVVWSFTTAAAGGTGTGLTGEYYDNMDFTSFVLTRVDATVNFDWGGGSPDPSIGADTFSVRWIGQVEPLYSETYTFYTNSDDGVRLWVDSQLVVDNWTDHAPTENSGTIALTAGVKYDIQMDYYENGGGAVAQLRWSSVSQAKEIIPQSQLFESAGPTPPGLATSPDPADSATDITIDADLSWSAGSGATSHDVYFGTSSPGSFQGNQTTTTFDTGAMANDTTYYWRIDEINAGGTTTGTVWSFTTIVAAPSQATNPDPADTATDIAVDNDLSWTAGSGATSHDVYFGTSSPGTFQGNQTAATFDTGAMDNDTTYYWRIDEVNAATTTNGSVWSFTTITSGQPVTKEFGDATNTDYPGTIEDTLNNFGNGGDDNLSTIVTLNTYTWPADTVANTIIIKWDLSDIPTDTTVTEATLYLYQTDSGGDSSYDVPVHKIVNVNPVISACTWNTYDGTNSWTGGADGGQSDTAPAENTPSLNTTNNEYKTWSVTNMVADWVSTPANNYGMLVNSDDVASVDSYRFFASNEVADASTRPKLILTYIAGSPAQATNPDPNDAAADVSTSATLSWTAGSAATSHDVYFGTTSPGAFQGNQAATTFDPGTLSYDITYYWRIDEINAAGTTAGNLWSFTTEAAPQPPGQPTNPSPADSATDVDVDADLSWTAGTGSTSSDVYFGTSSPGSLQGNQTETSFDPGTMANDTTYYWRIDEINADGTTTGNVWSFTTIVAAPSQATNPSPADTATDVDIDEDLSWTAGSGSTSSDVYFGTSSPGAFQGNQTATTFEPGTMANNTTYYWRIDEINAGGTTTGTVWSFTTIVAAPSQATNPSPADSATDVDIDADLSWTAGSGSTSSDVYFGTTSPGTFQGNQTATTFDPGTMANGATYYWRIDELNAGGTTTGTVWSFTTIVAVPGQASSPSPADTATDVTINADLSWTAGAGSTSSDVYFGTTSPGTFQGNQTATTFDPGTMANGTTYYWRIDEINTGGTTNGTVWSFTTVASAGDEIIGWWELNDESGSTAADSTTYGNDGTLVGPPAWTDDAERGWCLDFTGENNYVTLPNESFFDITSNVSVMGWMKASYVSWRNFSTIVAKGTNNSGGWALHKASRANGMSFYVDVTGMPWYGIQAGVGIFDNQWHHVAGVYDGSNAYIYIDGGLDSNSIACSGNMTTNNWDVYIGESSQELIGGATNAREWDGFISDVRIYNYALTQSQINDIYTGGPTPPGQATNPSPADSATDVSVDADLSWTAGTDSTSSDVYFGTTSPGTFQGNQTATTFDPGTMANDTTYYWRIDEINTAGTTTGNVWNFTTEAAPVTIKINFQPAAAQVPTGYEVDSGEAYADRGNGLTYGWDVKNTQTRDRNADPDQRYDTLNHLQKQDDRTWEIELSNGTYDVWLVCGDPSFTDQVNTMDVEGTVCTDPDGQDNFDEYNIQVNVTDGRLTITPAAGSSNSKICFVEITN